MAEQKQYKEGHFIGVGIALGVAMGTAIITPFAIIFDMSSFMGMGPAFGVSIGVAIGAALEAKAKREGRIIPLTPEEKQKQHKNTKRVLLIMVGGLAVLALVLLMIFVLRR